MLNGRATNRILYFASCLTLNTSDDELSDFCKRSGAKAVVGFTRWVGWLDSAAFDFLLLPRLLDATNMKPVFNSLEREHEGFVRNLGFRMATASWATSRRPSTP